MIKLIKIALLFVALCSSHLAIAEGKIAVLNAQQAIINTELAQSRLKALRAEQSYAKNREELEALAKAHDEAMAQLSKDAAVMSNEQKQAEAKKIQEKRADIQHIKTKLQTAEQELLQQVAQMLAKDLQVVVNDLIKAEGIGLLLDRQAAMHVDSSYSITAKVTDKLNQLKK